jgi:hypothetical protein
MRWVMVGVLFLHGLIHLLGFVKAFGLAEINQLSQPIGRSMGLVWIVASVLMVAASVVIVVAPQWFWLVGACALVLSQSAIFVSWSDAKFGTLANILLLVTVVFRFASHGPPSLRQEFAETVRAGLSESLRRPRIVSKDDLRGLPEPVRRYLLVTGSVGQPQVVNFRATWRGRIRSSAADPWMNFRAEQYNFYSGLPSRLFFMDATMKGLPVDVFHRFVGVAATFRVRMLSLFTMVNAKGPVMNRAETVTLFNDICVLAPSMLIGEAIQWLEVDAHTTRARYTRGTETITADLMFNDIGELINFASDDRPSTSADGKTLTAQRWTTPLGRYRSIGARRVSTLDEVRYDAPTGNYAYGEFELLTIDYNVGVGE